jgi:hypothetical protein
MGLKSDQFRQSEFFQSGQLFYISADDAVDKQLQRTGRFDAGA